MPNNIFSFKWFVSKSHNCNYFPTAINWLRCLMKLKTEMLIFIDCYWREHPVGVGGLDQENIQKFCGFSPIIIEFFSFLLLIQHHKKWAKKNLHHETLLVEIRCVISFGYLQTTKNSLIFLLVMLKLIREMTNLYFSQSSKSELGSTEATNRSMMNIEILNTLLLQNQPMFHYESKYS